MSPGLPFAQVKAAEDTTVNQPPPVELPWYRNETTKVYGNPDGTLTAEVYSQPVHYQNGGQWLDINNSLQETSDKQTMSNQANKFSVKFPKETKKENNFPRLFEYSIAGKTILFGLPAAATKNPLKSYANPQTAKGEFKENQAKLKEVYPGVTFEYMVDGSKVKENIVLQSYQGKNSFEFMIKASGLTAAKQENGSIAFKDQASGQFLFNIPRPYMYDSNKEAGPEGVVSPEVTQDITATKEGFVLTVTADEKFLQDPSRIYPVTVDPWIDYFDAQDTYIASNYPSYNYYNTAYLYVGHDATIGKTRSLVKWLNLPQIPNAEVVSAEVGLWETDEYTQVADVNMHQVTSSYDHKAVKWKDMDEGRLVFNTTAASTVGTFTEDWYNYFDATELVKGWYQNPQTNYGVMFKYDDALEESKTRRTFTSTDYINPDGSRMQNPKLVIKFRAKEFLGIQDYWQYVPAQFPEGSGAVNVINGNLVYNIPILNLPSRLNAFNLSMVYNSRSNYQDIWGYGWNLSAQRRLIFGPNNYSIEYQDETGTRAQFTKTQTDTATTYTAPEGTYLGLTVVDNGYQIKRTDETVLYFDQYGRNKKISDEKGNTIEYVFDDSAQDARRIVKIKELFGNETTGREINLTYVNGELDLITDFENNKTKLTYTTKNGSRVLDSITYAFGTTKPKTIGFNYDANKRLVTVTDAKLNTGGVEYDSRNQVSKITDPRSTDQEPIFAQLDYDTDPDHLLSTYAIYTDAKGYKTYFKNNSNENRTTVNVIQVTEDYQSVQATTTTYEWNNNNLTKVVEPNRASATASGATHTAVYDAKANLTVANSPSNIGVTNSYDNKSNLTTMDTHGTQYNNTYDSKSNLITSTNNHGLTDYNSYGQYGNLEKTTTPTRVTHNRLQNSGFELTPIIWTNRGIGQYSTITTESVFGKSAGKIVLSASDGAGYYSQSIPVASDESDKDYTLSVYAKTAGVTGTGANLRIYFKDSGGNYIKDTSGNIIKLETKALAGTTDWTRLSTYFTAPANTATIQTDLLFTGAGTVYFDGAELVYGRVLDQYYSNENASFEWGALDNWTLSSLAAGDGKSSEMAKRGSYSLKINGTGAAKYLAQTVEVQGNTGDPLTISGWAYATAPNPSGGYFALDVVLVYSDGTEELFIREFDKTRANQWQMMKSTFQSKKPFIRAKVYLLYYNQTGTVFFDNVKLEERGSVSQVEYDSSGNFVESSADALNNKSNFTYDANGNLLSSTDAGGKKANFLYTALNKLKQVTLKAATTAQDIVVNYE